MRITYGRSDAAIGDNAADDEPLDAAFCAGMAAAPSNAAR
jgi:hypothetical protein